MTQAIFVAKVPDHRADDASQLKHLLDGIRGVKNWRMDSNGEIVIDYDHEETSSNVIEEALAGIGYYIKHIHDDARLGRADRPNYGVDENRGGNTYGR